MQARHNTGADSTFVSNSYSQAEAESQESCKSNEEVSPAVAKAESGVENESDARDLSNIHCSCKNTSIDLLMLMWYVRTYEQLHIVMQYNMSNFRIPT